MSVCIGETSCNGLWYYEYDRRVCRSCCDRSVREMDGGSLGQGFAMLSIVVAVALVLQIYFLRPKTDNMVD